MLENSSHQSLIDAHSCRGQLLVAFDVDFSSMLFYNLIKTGIAKTLTECSSAYTCAEYEVQKTKTLKHIRGRLRTLKQHVMLHSYNTRAFKA